MSGVNINDKKVEIQHLEAATGYEPSMYYPPIVKCGDPNEEVWSDTEVGGYEYVLLEIIKHMDKRITELESKLATKPNGDKEL